VGVLRKVFQFSLLSGLLAISNVYASPIQATFTGVEGTNAFGYYIGPYYGQLESLNVSLFCDDFANEVNFGQKWMANLSKITTGSDLGQTRYGDMKDASYLYQQIAWLDTQFATQDKSQWGDIHATIWQIFDPSQAPVPSSQYWLSQARQNYATGNYDNFRVVTNVGPVMKTGQVQEFLTMLPDGSPTFDSPASTSTPEPGPAILIGSALFLSATGLRMLHGRRSATLSRTVTSVT
jgi:hypothetical protein